MKKVLLAMIALLFAISAAPVVYAEDATDATASDAATPASSETSPEELPPLIDPAIAEETNS